ncbi:MAG: RimK-like ATPgrasp N-terminal domain-containing protein [Candidatus Bathyarchaeia archaeon]
MLVVSNIALTTRLPLMRPSAFLKSKVKDFILNLNNDYRYLKTAYYVSMHAEILGNTVIPSSENIIAASRTPILLLKASKAGVPILPYLITDSVKRIILEIGLPAMVFAVNPFSFEGFRIAKYESALYRAVKSLSMNYKFPVCAQPLRGEVVSVKSFFGKCESAEKVKEVAKKVYEVFKLPLCKLHVQLINGEAYLCGLQPLKKEEITVSDLRLISEEASRIPNLGDQIVG